jgi:sulfoxide reductase heme-binding subunit YedZ
MIATGSHFFWITSRAAGIVALLLSSAAVGVGLTMGGRFAKRRGPDLLAVHEALALATLAALGVHAGALLFDSYFHPSVLDLTVPFVRDYREPYMAIGIIAGWGLLALGLSFYVRTRIGTARWRIIHRFTALAWILGVVHTLGEGSDAGRPWFLAMVAIAVLPPLALLVARIARTRSPAARGAFAGRRPLRLR